MENRLPFIEEGFTKQFEELKIFVHDNIYMNEGCINLLYHIIKTKLEPFNIDFVMDNYYKVISLKLKKTNMKKIQNDDEEVRCMSIIVDIFTEFFMSPIVNEKLLLTSNPLAKEVAAGNKQFIKLMFNILQLHNENLIRIYL